MADQKMTPRNFITTASHTEKTTPDAYRLARQKDGTLILQGAYAWLRGEMHGHEWRDIPTVDIEQEG